MHLGGRLGNCGGRFNGAYEGIKASQIRGVVRFHHMTEKHDKWNEWCE
jgi:hypothetical protein